MERLIIHVWFPWLAADRLRQSGEIESQQTLVLTSRYQGTDYIDALCRQGQRRGLQIGMRLADARALCPDLVSRVTAPAADARDLHHLALWARRYSPLTAPDHGAAGSAAINSGAGAMMASAIARDGDGIWLDVAGATHLHGGLRSLLADMLWRLRRAGLQARLGGVELRYGLGTCPLWAGAKPAAPIREGNQHQSDGRIARASAAGGAAS